MNNQEIIDIQKKLAKNYSEQKELSAKLLQLYIQNGGKTHKGINKLNTGKMCQYKPIPIKLAKLLDLDEDSEATQLQITKLLFDYIKKKKLIDPEDACQINPNNKIRTALGMNNKDDLTFFNIQCWVRKSYPIEQ